MKKAKLPGGRVLTFPDTHTDDQIDTHVKGLLQREAQEKKEREQNEARRKEHSEERKHQDKIKAVEGQGKATEMAGKMVLQGMEEIGKKLEASSKGLRDIAPKLDALGEIAAALELLAKNIDSLEGCIKQSAEAVIKVLKAPRKIVHSAKGKPLGMQIEE